jgi:hypothetical protein
MDEERCEWSDLIKSHCAHCRGLKTAEEEAKDFDQEFFNSHWFVSHVPSD